MDSVGQLSRIAWKERKFSFARKDSVKQEENNFFIVLTKKKYKILSLLFMIILQGILDAIKDVVLMDKYVFVTLTCLQHFVPSQSHQ